MSTILRISCAWFSN